MAFKYNIYRNNKYRTYVKVKELKEILIFKWS
jgi:hypothetical protein